MRDAANGVVPHVDVMEVLRSHPLVLLDDGCHLAAGNIVVASAWPAEAVRGMPWTYRTVFGSHCSARTAEEAMAESERQIRNELTRRP